MIGFIDDHKAVHGIEPICKVLPIAPSTYHSHAAQRANPEMCSSRTKRDSALRLEVQRVYAENWSAPCRVVLREVWL